MEADSTAGSTAERGSSSTSSVAVVGVTPSHSAPRAGHDAPDLPADYREQAMMNEQKLEVRPSTVPEMGLGLFVKNGHTIPPFQVLSEYRGSRLSPLEVSEKYGHGTEYSAPYAVTVSANTIIDASTNDPSNPARFANDCPPATAEYIRRRFGKVCRVNAMFQSDAEERLYVMSLEELKSDEEVFVDYGPGYWGTREEQIEGLVYEHMCSSGIEREWSISQLVVALAENLRLILGDPHINLDSLFSLLRGTMRNLLMANKRRFVSRFAWETPSQQYLRITRFSPPNLPPPQQTAVAPPRSNPFANNPQSTPMNPVRRMISIPPRSTIPASTPTVGSQSKFAGVSGSSANEVIVSGVSTRLSTGVSTDVTADVPMDGTHRNATTLGVSTSQKQATEQMAFPSVQRNAMMLPWALDEPPQNFVVFSAVPPHLQKDPDDVPDMINRAEGRDMSDCDCETASVRVTSANKPSTRYTFSSLNDPVYQKTLSWINGN